MIIMAFSCDKEQNIQDNSSFIGEWSLVKTEKLIRGEGKLENLYNASQNSNILNINENFLVLEFENSFDTCFYVIESMENKSFINLESKNYANCKLNDGFIYQENDTLIIDGSFNDVGAIWYFVRKN